MVFIATYVISDIHGQYDMFMELIDKIDLKQTDTLYVLGDILGRGPHPIKVLKKLIEEEFYSSTNEMGVSVIC